MGRCENDGIPRVIEPFRRTHSMDPAEASATALDASGGFFATPSPALPWHDAHSRSYSLRPARAARSSPSYGFVFPIAAAGACCRRDPAAAQPPTPASAIMSIRIRLLGIGSLSGTIDQPHGRVGRSHKIRRTVTETAR